MSTPDKNQALAVVIEKLTEIVDSINHGSPDADTTRRTTNVNPVSGQKQKAMTSQSDVTEDDMKDHGESEVSFVQVSESDILNDAIETVEVTTDSPSKVVISLPVKVGNMNITNSEGLLKSLKQLDDKAQEHDRGLGKDDKGRIGAQAEVYKCTKCDYSSHNKHYLKQHVVLVHMAERPFKCPLCDYAGKRSHSLKEHLIVHSPYRPYTCPFCSASFRKKSHLTNHIKLHASEQAVACSICKHFIANRSELSRHMRRAHVGSGVYTCNMCEYATDSDTDIIMHMHCHGNPKVYICSSCSFVAVHDGIMKKHITTSHDGKASFNVTSPPDRGGPLIFLKCSECGFTTNDRDRLKHHMFQKHESAIMTGKKGPEDSVSDETGTSSDANQSAAPNKEGANLLATGEHKNPAKPTEMKESNKESTLNAVKVLPRYACSYCSFTSAEDSTLLSHMLTHSSKVTTPNPKTGISTTQSTSDQGKDDCWSQGYTQDKAAGLYCCMICGYTCDHQRTIKAHIWKHSGHKDINYPTFQNGPLSIYEDTAEDSGDKADARQKMPPADSKSKETPTKAVPLQKIVAAAAKANPAEQPVLMTQVPSKQSKDAQSSGTDHLDKSTSETLIKNAQTPPTGPLLHKIRQNTGVSSEMSSSGEKIVVSRQENPLESDSKIPDRVLHNANETNTSTTSRKRKLAAEPSELDVSIPKMIIRDGVPVAPDHNVIVQQNSQLYATSVLQMHESGSSSPMDSPRCSTPSSGTCPTPSDSASKSQDQQIESEVSSNDAANTVREEQVMDIAEYVGQDDVYEVVIETTEDQTCLSEEEEEDEDPEDPETEHKPVSLRALLQRQHSSGDLQQEHKSSGVRVRSGSLELESVEKTPPHHTEKGISSSLLAVIEQFRNDASTGSSMTTQDGTQPQEYYGDDIEKLANQFRCRLCRYTNRTLTGIKLHMTTHKVKKLMDCSICGHATSSSQQLQEHIMTNHCKESMIACKLCASTFSNRAQLKIHMRIHQEMQGTSSDQESTEDEGDGDKSIVSNSLKTSTSLNKSYSNVEYVCENCYNTFPTLEGVLKHKMNKACWSKSNINCALKEEKDSFKCNFCEYEGMSVRSLKSHMKRHWNDLRANRALEENRLTQFKASGGKDDEVKKIYVCEKCTSVFPSIMDLLAHKPDTCTGVIPKCTQCDFTSANADLFKKHMHYHGKLYKCQQCDFVSKSYNKMDGHLKQHIEPQDLKCTLCDFMATSVRSLKSHMKRHANDQRFVRQPLEQYKCILCGYICHHLPALKSHMWRHASDSSYSYERTNAVINAAQEMDSTAPPQEKEQKKAQEVKEEETFVREPQYTTPQVGGGLVAFRCCHCFFETFSKKELNDHMKRHMDIIMKTMEVNNDLFMSHNTKEDVEGSDGVTAGSQEEDSSA